MKRKYHKQVDKSYHSTLCCEPNCYRNCHERCGLIFSLDPNVLKRCVAIKQLKTKCSICGHERDSHRHYNALWEEVEEDEKVVDEEARKKYGEAQNVVQRKEVLRELCQVSIDDFAREVDDITREIGKLAEEYGNLSLSGSFSSQVEKSIEVLNLNIDAMKTDGSDPEMIAKLEKGKVHLAEKLGVLREAREKTRKFRNLITIPTFRLGGLVRATLRAVGA